jgi:hypothetical protein
VGATIILLNITLLINSIVIKVKEYEPEMKLIWGHGHSNRIYPITKNKNSSIAFSLIEKIGRLIFPL